MRAALHVLLVASACASPSPSPPPSPSPAPSLSPSPSLSAAPPADEATFHGQRLRLTRIEEDGIVLPSPIACIPVEASRDPDRAFPVLYAADGEYFVDELDLCGVVESLARAGLIEPWVVVALPSTAAREDVLARHPDSLAALVSERLEPELAQHVALTSGREARAVIGYSYGGLAALRMTLAQPERFGRVVAMSPSLWFDDQSALAALRDADVRPMRLYLDAGSEEEPGVVPPMVADVRALAAIARERGLVFGRDLAVREIIGDVHDMRVAGPRLPGALAFTLGEHDVSDRAPETLTIEVYRTGSARAPRTFAIEAAYGHGIVLSWPPDLADARLGTTRLGTARIPTRATSPITVEVHGVRSAYVPPG